jgi:hypothetical protein
LRFSSHQGLEFLDHFALLLAVRNGVHVQAHAKPVAALVGRNLDVCASILGKARVGFSQDLKSGPLLNAEIRQPDHTNATDVYPRVLWRGGAPNGGATGMLVKDYRGKNAEQVIWKFDAALESKIFEALKQAAIEEGQWTEKRETKDTVGLSVFMQRLNAGRDRVAADKRAREGK